MNTKSFYDRRGRINDKCEFYMAFLPKTLLSTAKIDKWIFYIPEEFSYPSLKYLDYCSMWGY